MGRIENSIRTNQILQPRLHQIREYSAVRNRTDMSPWGVVSCVSGAVLYLIGVGADKDADYVNSVKRVNQLKDLVPLLDTRSKSRPLVVAISGKVGAETPINCKDSDLQGVIVEEQAEQQFLKLVKLDDQEYWRKDYVSMLSTFKEVPWYLDDKTGRVFVIGARDASEFNLKLGSEVYEAPGATTNSKHGLVMLGVKRIQRLLPTGTTLTVIGEAVKDKSTGSISIQRTSTGTGSFYVSEKSVDQLVADFRKKASTCKFFSVGFTLFGACLVFI